jgi:hypothetical protein
MSKCNCMLCKNKNNFPESTELLNDFTSGNVTIFAGSGISTESHNVLKETFYDNIAEELDILSNPPSFPELMERYCSKTNGRLKLLKKIRDRFKYIQSFPELERIASKFHKEISTLRFIKTIVTTNWDMYFEENCAATPFVTDQDLAFWENEDRRILKIHGSINNYGSIVATTSDYAKCQERLHHGLIGSILKTLFATQTILFIGYSLRDTDFLNIWEFVSGQMNGLQKQAYVITPFENEKEKIVELGLIPIIADGTDFISQLKRHLISNKFMLPDSIYSEAQKLLLIVSMNHDMLFKEFNVFDYPQIYITASYQDGMIHALERMLKLRNTGEYSHSHYFNDVFKHYENFQRKKLKEKRYEDVAYIEGYLNALYFTIVDEENKEDKFPPLYYAFGTGTIYDFKQYKKIIKKLPALHKASYHRIKKTVKNSTSNDIAYHHHPWF